MQFQIDGKLFEIVKRKKTAQLVYSVVVLEENGSDPTRLRREMGSGKWKRSRYRGRISQEVGITACRVTEMPFIKLPGVVFCRWILMGIW